MVRRGRSSLQPGDDVEYAPVALVVGGFHLAYEYPDQIERVIADLLSLNVQQVCPTHCTGDVAIAMFDEAFGDGFIRGGAGKIITLP
jgi:7,8-dihydropterin-6-yl-methyl-4-(beta-D-ribofuranosyl)aminobenzene 5'-phosphate synthase